jgi:hypothetical protein
MALRGGLLLAVLATCAVALPVATVVVFGRLRGPRPVKIATRIALIGCSQLAAVLVVVVAINDYAYFFTSWSELFGPSTVKHVVDDSDLAAPAHQRPFLLRHFGAPERRIPVAQAAASAPKTHPHLPAGSGATPVSGFSLPGDWATRGAVVTMTVASAQATEPLEVYLPGVYFRRHHGRLRLPVTEVFGGAQTSALAMVYRPPLPGTLLEATARHLSDPMVLVLVNGKASGQPMLSCAAPSAETFYGRVVPTALRRALHLHVSRLATLGLGSGGECALKLAMTDPQRFRAAVSLLGCLPEEPATAVGAVPLMLAPGWQHGPRCGMRATAEFLRSVRAPSSADELIGYDRIRKHVTQLWDRLFNGAFWWLSTHRPAPGVAA